MTAAPTRPPRSRGPSATKDSASSRPAPPSGWSGKLWAISQGITRAGQTDLVLLTDADIVHADAHLGTLVAFMDQYDLDLVSEMVELACDSWAERALVPAFVFFFQLLYPFAWVNDYRRRTAAAAGGTILIRNKACNGSAGWKASRAR